MESFDLISKLMLTLGAAGGLYTFIYGIWIWKYARPENPKPVADEQKSSDDEV